VIDHGAALYFHHAWSGGSLQKDGAAERFAAQLWSPDDHVFLAYADRLAAADAEIAPLLDEAALTEVLGEVPDLWLEPVPGAETPDAVRAAYVAFLTARLGTRQWLPQVVGR
jgi:hypothetical protein